jgi:hypothetical protein
LIGCAQCHVKRGIQNNGNNNNNQPHCRQLRKMDGGDDDDDDDDDDNNNTTQLSEERTCYMKQARKCKHHVRIVARETACESTLQLWNL